MMQPVKEASKMLYETIAVSLFAHFLMFALLVAHSIIAHMSCSQSCLELTCFVFFPMDFLGNNAPNIS